MSGRATQSTMRLMGSWAVQSTADTGVTWCVEGLSNTKADVKSWNTALVFPVLFTWHLHFLFLSSLCSLVTRVMLQRVETITSYLHEEETIRESLLSLFLIFDVFVCVLSCWCSAYYCQQMSLCKAGQQTHPGCSSVTMTTSSHLQLTFPQLYIILFPHTLTRASNIIQISISIIQILFIYSKIVFKLFPNGSVSLLKQEVKQNLLFWEIAVPFEEFHYMWVWVRWLVDKSIIIHLINNEPLAMLFKGEKTNH